MISLPDEIAIDGGEATHGPQRFATRPHLINPLEIEKWAKVAKFSGATLGFTHRPAQHLAFGSGEFERSMIQVLQERSRPRLPDGPR